MQDLIDSLISPRSVILDDARQLPGNILLFTQPSAWCIAHHPPEIPVVLAQLESALAHGAYIAGAFAYEVGFFLEPHLQSRLPAKCHDPFILAGIYDTPQRLENDAAELLFTRLEQLPPCHLGEAEPLWNRADYAQAFQRIQQWIGAGDVYQVNLTFPLRIPYQGCPLSRYPQWRRKARAGHGVWVRAHDRDLFSLSPELFLASDDGVHLKTRPMKGTCARKPGSREDREVVRTFAEDRKQRAENVMIVDLLRNDFGRIATTGTVRVSDLFTVETYPTLHTLTSGIECAVHSDTTLTQLLRAVFPSGSVTGAPKIQAMEIIRDLEPMPRGFYCGMAGAMGPGWMRWNVAIRTLVAEHDQDHLRLNVGSAVTADSTVSGEYEECLLKARFVTEHDEPFQLLETLRWERAKGFYFLAEHLERLAASAQYFSYSFDRARIERALYDAVAAVTVDVLRVRLLLDVTGRITIETVALPEQAVAWSFAETDWQLPGRLTFSPHRICAHDRFIHHKTTRRALYEMEWQRVTRMGLADEVLFLNEADQVTEGSRSNLFLYDGQQFITPPLTDGLLDGVLRQILVKTVPVIERSIVRADIEMASRLFIGNSVTGLRAAVFVS